MIVKSKIVHPQEKSCYSWTELNIENGEIGSRSRLYQPEAFAPSGPGLGLSTMNNFCFFPFFLSSHPLAFPVKRGYKGLISHTTGQKTCKSSLCLHTWRLFLAGYDFNLWLQFEIQCLATRPGPSRGDGSWGKKEKNTKLLLVLSPRPGPDGSNASGWYRRLREPILPFSMFNSVQL